MGFTLLPYFKLLRNTEVPCLCSGRRAAQQGQPLPGSTSWQRTRPALHSPLWQEWDRARPASALPEPAPGCPASPSGDTPCAHFPGRSERRVVFSRAPSKTFASEAPCLSKPVRGQAPLSLGQCGPSKRAGNTLYLHMHRSLRHSTSASVGP